MIRVEHEGGRALVTIHRPEVLNALNAATLAELQRLAEQFEGDDDVRAIVITGAVGTGRSQAFVAGADIEELVDLDPAGAERFGALGQASRVCPPFPSCPFVSFVDPSLPERGPHQDAT